MAEALYRKYRPKVFSDVVGQDHIERTIRNAIDKDQVSHAYLFCGPRGTGKTTTARLLAKALLCEDGPTSEPDGTCQQCTEIAEGTHPDVYELDAASRTGVENIREEIISRVSYAPTRGTYKVYIIDEVHMLSTAAFNALLKTLEEPPSHVVFILCTTDPQKVPDTVHSRCQRFEFHRLSNDEIVARLGAVCVEEGVEFDGDALELIAHKAEGGMRNALTSLEQVIAFGAGKVTLEGAEDLLGSLGTSDMAEIMRFVGTRDIASCFTWTADYVESGADLAQFVRDMAEHVRNLYVMSLVGTDAALEVPEAERKQLAEELELFSPDRLARLLGVLGDVSSELRSSSNPRLNFEIALTRMVRPDSDLSLESLAERIEALEAGHSSVVTVVPAAPSSSAAPATATAVPVPAPAEGDKPAISGGDAEGQAAQSTPSAAAETASSVEAPGEVPAGPTRAAEAVVSQPPASPEPPIQQKPATQTDSASVPAHAQDLAAVLANPAALQRVWHAVVTAVKKEKVSFGVLLVGTKARAAEDGSGVVIEFPASNPLAYSIATKPEMSEMMSRAFENATGAKVPFICEQGTEIAPGQEVIEPMPVAEYVPEQSASPAPSAPSATMEVEAAAMAVPEAEGAPLNDQEVAAEPEAMAEALPWEEAPAAGQDVAEQAGGSADDADDLAKMFSDAMGGAVVFEEVDE